ncbi:MAG: PH domain-containing protein [Anaerolineae bacterium]
MQAKQFTPSPKYLTNLRITLSLIALAILAGGFILGVLIAFEEGFGALAITLLITLAANLLWWVPGMLLSGPYYRSLRYEIHEDEIIVNVGIVTQSVKHVPFRTMTNLTVKRGILDRWLGTGTVNIQTAGISGSSGQPEQSLVGLENPQEVYEMVVTALHRFRGGMAPTSAEEEAPAGTSSEALNAILDEVRTIRQALEQNA